MQEASRWRFSDRAEGLSPEAVLLGLLAEAESRAADELGHVEIDEEAIHTRWPQMRRAEDAPVQTNDDETPWRFSSELRAAIATVVDRLALFPQPLEIATEHLLLGLAAAPNEAGEWLREQGLDPDAMTAELFALYGVNSEVRPLECDGLDIPAGPKPEYPAHEESPRDDSIALETEVGEPAPAVPLDEDDLAAPSLSARESVQVLRILDAAANRAREGLRVVEDYVRFVLDDSHLTRKLKEWRHELTEVLGCIPSAGRMAARDTAADVGTRITTPGEVSRRAPEDVLTANFKRLQESLRSLEEYGKLFRADLAARVEQLRYRTYTLHRAAAIVRTSLDRLEDVRLYVLLDGRESLEEFERLARVLIENGVDAIQLRDKTLDDRTLLARARRLRELTRRGDALFIVNDRPDIAALAHADGVHVGAGGVVGERCQDSRRTGRPGRRLDALHRAGPRGGSLRGELHRSRPDVSLADETIRGIPGDCVSGRGRFGNPSSGLRNRWNRYNQSPPRLGNRNSPDCGQRRGPGGVRSRGNGPDAGKSAAGIVQAVDLAHPAVSISGLYSFKGPIPKRALCSGPE